jgi:hypothetical protein
VQRHVVERQLHVVAGAVGERHVVELDLPPQPRSSTASGRSVSCAARPAARRSCPARPSRTGSRVDLRELADRVEEPVERRQEADEHADRHVAVDHLQAADEQDADRGQRADELDPGK